MEWYNGLHLLTSFTPEMSTLFLKCNTEQFCCQVETRGTLTYNIFHSHSHHLKSSFSSLEKEMWSIVHMNVIWMFDAFEFKHTYSGGQND